MLPKYKQVVFSSNIFVNLHKHMYSHKIKIKIMKPCAITITDQLCILCP